VKVHEKYLPSIELNSVQRVGRGLLGRDSGVRVRDLQRYDESALSYAIREEVAVRPTAQ
jgi:hypothetical protein